MFENFLIIIFTKEKILRNDIKYDEGVVVEKIWKIKDEISENILGHLSTA